MTLGDDLVGNARRTEDGGHVLEGVAEIGAQFVDVIPLVGRGRYLDIVGVQLELVELPLKDEQGS